MSSARGVFWRDDALAMLNISTCIQQIRYQQIPSIGRYSYRSWQMLDGCASMCTASKCGDLTSFSPSPIAITFFGSMSSRSNRRRRPSPFDAPFGSTCDWERPAASC